MINNLIFNHFVQLACCRLVCFAYFQLSVIVKSKLMLVLIYVIVSLVGYIYNQCKLKKKCSQLFNLRNLVERQEDRRPPSGYVYACGKNTKRLFRQYYQNS